jgi:phosphatidylglycerophosphate synthase
MADRSGVMAELVARRGPAAGPLTGLVAQLGLLATLAATVGLAAAGWLIGTGFALITCVLLVAGLNGSATRSLGPADVVTLTRAVLVGGVAALVADSLGRPVSVGVVIPLTVTALLLDAVDGQVARRTGTMSAFGARFDMEVDAFLIFVLSVDQVRTLGIWVVALGAMRYGFMLAGRLLPWLTVALPPRFTRKVVAAVQGVVLVVAATGLLPGRLAAASVAVALLLLCWSFGRDVVWLIRQRRRAPASEVPVSAERAEHPDRVAA